MFGDDKELRELREKWPQMSQEDKRDMFLWKMVWFHHHKHIPGNPNQAINDLTKTLGESSNASEHLTKSIRNATWVAAVIGAVGVTVAIINLLRDFSIL